MPQWIYLGIIFFTEFWITNMAIVILSKLHFMYFISLGFSQRNKTNWMQRKFIKSNWFMQLQRLKSPRICQLQAGSRKASGVIQSESEVLRNRGADGWIKWEILAHAMRPTKRQIPPLLPTFVLFQVFNRLGGQCPAALGRSSAWIQSTDSNANPHQKHSHRSPRNNVQTGICTFSDPVKLTHKIKVTTCTL